MQNISKILKNILKIPWSWTRPAREILLRKVQGRVSAWLAPLEVKIDFADRKIDLASRYVQSMDHRIELATTHMQSMDHRIELATTHMQSMDHRIELATTHMQSMDHRIELATTHMQSMDHRIELAIRHMQSMDCKIELALERIERVEKNCLEKLEKLIGELRLRHDDQDLAINSVMGDLSHVQSELLVLKDQIDLSLA